MSKVQCQYCPSNIDESDLKHHVKFYHSKQDKNLKQTSMKATNIVLLSLGFIVGALVMVFIL